MVSKRNLHGAVFSIYDGRKIKILEIDESGEIIYAVNDAERLSMIQPAVNRAGQLLSRE